MYNFSSDFYQFIWSLVWIRKKKWKITIRYFFLKFSWDCRSWRLDQELLYSNPRSPLSSINWVLIHPFFNFSLILQQKSTSILCFCLNLRLGCSNFVTKEEFCYEGRDLNWILKHNLSKVRISVIFQSLRFIFILNFFLYLLWTLTDLVC